MKKPEKKDWIFLLPLAGLALGAAGGRVLVMAEGVSRPMAEAGGTFFGPLVTGDNFALVGGLVGVAAGTVLAGRWARRGEE